jgi:hypothetical protein
MASFIDDGASKSEPASTSSKHSSSSLKILNQKAYIATQMLAIGDINHARVILDRLPTLSVMTPEISDQVCRLLRVIIEPVYAPLRPTAAFTNLKPPPKKDYIPVSTSLTRTCPIFEKVIQGRKVVTPKYRFFYQGWKSELPVCHDFNSVLKQLRVLLPYVGPRLYKDVILATQIARLGKAHITKV